MSTHLILVIRNEFIKWLESGSDRSMHLTSLCLGGVWVGKSVKCNYIFGLWKISCLKCVEMEFFCLCRFFFSDVPTHLPPPPAALLQSQWVEQKVLINLNHNCMGFLIFKPLDDDYCILNVTVVEGQRWLPSNCFTFTFTVLLKLYLQLHHSPEIDEDQVLQIIAN